MARRDAAMPFWTERQRAAYHAAFSKRKDELRATYVPPDRPPRPADVLDAEAAALAAVDLAGLPEEDEARVRELEAGVQAEEAAQHAIRQQELEAYQERVAEAARVQEQEEQEKARLAAEAEKERAERAEALTEEARIEEEQEAELRKRWENYEKFTKGALERKEVKKFKRPSPMEGFPSADRPELQEDFVWPSKEEMKARWVEARRREETLRRAEQAAQWERDQASAAGLAGRLVCLRQPVRGRVPD